MFWLRGKIDSVASKESKKDCKQETPAGQTEIPSKWTHCSERSNSRLKGPGSVRKNRLLSRYLPVLRFSTILI